MPYTDLPAQAADAQQFPVYYVVIDGLTTVHYATSDNVTSVTASKDVRMNVPKFSGGEVDTITGVQNVRTCSFELLDHDGAITSLISTEDFGRAPGAPSTLINRKVEIYGGYAGIAESSFVPVFTGQIRAVRAGRELVSYVFTATDISYLLDATIMANATKQAPTIIQGNVVNVFWSILTGTFSLSGTFPLDYISSATDISPNAHAELEGTDCQALGDAYDGDPNDYAIIRAIDETPARVRYTFADSIESGRLLIENVYLDVGFVAGTTNDGELTVRYSLDGGNTFTELAIFRSQVSETLEGPILDAQNMADFIVEFIATSGTGDTVFQVGEIAVRRSAPTGLTVPTAYIDTDSFTGPRDTWHTSDDVRLILIDSQNGRDYLTREFLRIFQAMTLAKGSGLLGIAFHVPSAAPSSATTITEDDIIRVYSWERLYEDHLNKFRFYGDHDADDDSFVSLYDTDTAEDTADRTATLETIEYVGESQWLRSDLYGDQVAAELAGRLRLRYLGGPAQLVIDVPMTKLLVEVGDVVAVTHSQLPDLRAGSRGITDRMMTVLGIVPRFEQGAIQLTLLDTNLRRYGVVAPDSQVDFLSATTLQQETFFFISDASEQMSDATDGYRMI